MTDHKTDTNVNSTRSMHTEPAARDHDLPSAAGLTFRLKPLSASSVKNDVLSGMTVSLMLIPEAIAFAFVAGVDPVIGLFSAFFMGLITAVFGGRPGMISGATGAMAVVIIPLVAQYGVEYLVPTVVLCGLIQVLVGCCKLGKLIRMVPHPVMLGFVNGLAIVIGMAQLDSFKVIGVDGAMEWLGGGRMGWMLAMMLLTMAICFFIPRWTKAVPGSLAAIIVVAVIAFFVNKSAPEGEKTLLTVKDFLVQGEQSKAVTDNERAKAAAGLEVAQAALPVDLGLGFVGGEHGPMGAPLTPEEFEAALGEVDVASVSMEGSFPKPVFMDAQFKGLLPPLNWSTFWIIAPFALILAGVGLIESLMTLTLVDEITETRGSGNRECIGQGVANILSGMFGGMGGCAMIGQSLINVKAGGRGRTSGIVAAIGLLLFVLVLAPWVERIPMAALVGVMMMVVIGTFEWATLKTWRKLPKSDIIIMLVVTLITVFLHNLALAVLIGVIVSALIFAWEHATHLAADRRAEDDGETTIYQLHGPLFFASATDFRNLFLIESDADNVVIDFYYTRVYDQSGLEAINFIAGRYRDAGKVIHLRHLSPECQSVLERAGGLVEIDVTGDPHYHIATDAL
ncbi:MAG: SulP family sulfate permease [Rhodothermales bacterium]|jgi:SulP family sulfate permease